ncbi:hypothetical protein OIG29_02280 [Neisseria meningitidis]|uniref:hypothetical protein n=1 Tax=Neisseria meningitidis TaxID=487 RepID=UPI0021F21DD5|nr:hypothetical protein [Neisseria meningitidis]MCV6777787.1 hypothetical protein [Neisseria meningitidis]
MKIEARFILQDHDTHDVIYSAPLGVVGITQIIKSACKFESNEDELNSGINEIGGEIQIFQFSVKSE